MKINVIILLFLLATFPTKIFAQTLKVNDTDFSKGRLGNIQTIDLKDLSKFHGHFCDGLAEGFLALQQGLYALYPDSVVDRTNTRIVSKPSPCLTDVAIYLTGGRYQFNSFYVSAKIEGLYVVQRIDNGKTVLVKRKPNVKPAIIDEMGSRAIENKLSACELDTLRKLEEQYADFLLKTSPKEMFEVVEIQNFLWQPDLKNDFKKTDILNKQIQNCEN
jgi:acetolactate decarboxylase